MFCVSQACVSFPSLGPAEQAAVVFSLLRGPPPGLQSVRHAYGTLLRVGSWGAQERLYPMTGRSWITSVGNEKGSRCLTGPGHKAQGAQLPQPPKLTTLEVGSVGSVGHGPSLCWDRHHPGAPKSYLLLTRSVALGAAHI